MPAVVIIKGSSMKTAVKTPTPVSRLKTHGELNDAREQGQFHPKRGCQSAAANHHPAIDHEHPIPPTPSTPLPSARGRVLVEERLKRLNAFWP